jgi:hypothetical protein
VKDGRERAGRADAQLVAAYRQGFGLAAVAVIASPHGVRIAAGDQAEDDVLAVEDSVQARWWCRHVSDAADIAASAVRLRRSAPDIAVAAAAAGEAVMRAAKLRHVELLSEEDVAAYAARAIARIDAELAQLRKLGELRTVNKSYQTYRLDAAGRGERVVPYAQWMRGYKEKLVRQLAATLRSL